MVSNVFNSESRKVYVASYATFADFPAAGSIDTIYIDDNTNALYRWTGSGYEEIGQYPQVATYADLPPAADNTGKIYFVETTTTTGIWPYIPPFGNTYPAGFYYSTGLTWEQAPMTAGAITYSDLSATVPITYNGSGVFGLDYNTTNLKLTASQLNTIQDIATTSSPTFVGLTVNTITSAAATVLALSSPAPASNVDAVGITIITANGVGSGSSAGGPITITSGRGSGASGANGGDINITTGNGSSGNPAGTLTLRPGTSATTGGITNIFAGAGSTSSSGGGQLNLVAGAAPGQGTAGNAVLTGGAASNSGTGGDVIITGGAAGTTAFAGNVRIRGGLATSGTQGAVIFDQGLVNLNLLTGPSLIAIDNSSNITTSTSALSPTFAGLSISNTGSVYCNVISTTTGSSNEAYLRLQRGDQANGNAKIQYATGNTVLFSVGLSTGSDNYSIVDQVSGVTLFEISPGASGATPIINSHTSQNALNYWSFGNDNNTSSAGAKLGINVGGTSASDPYFSWDVTGNYAWTAGIDVSDSGKFKIDYGATASPGSGTKFSIDTSGNVNIPSLNVSQLTGTDPSKNLVSSNLSGDVSSSGFTTTLATVNANVGTFGDSTHVTQLTVNGKGLITAASSVLITGAPPTGAAGGDLSGNYPNPTVAKINGVALGSTTATSGNILIGSGAAWVTNAMSGDITINSTGVTAIGANKVTLAQMAQIATASFLGRNTASTGNVEVLSTATAKTMLNLTGINSGDVTLAGENYLSILGQVITANAVNLSGTNATGILAAARFPALTGDVTTSSGAIATTIAANAVTYAKFQQVAASSLVGNPTGSLANAQGITLGTSLTFTSSTINAIQDIRTSASPTFASLTTTSIIKAATATNSTPDIYTYDATGSAYLGLGFGSVFTQGGIYVKSKAGNAYTFVLMDLWNGGGGITDFNNVYFYAQNTNTIHYTTSTVTIPLSTASTTTSTGALVVTGGAGIGGAVFAGGALNTTLTTDSSSVSTGSIIGAGGLGIAKKAYIGGALNVTDSTASTTTSTGSGIFSGGVGIAGAANVGTTITVGSSSAPTISTIALLSSATQNTSRITLAGQEFYQASNTSTDGIGFLLGVNRTANRQLWIVDTALSASSASHPVLRLGPGGDANGATVDCLATDGTTILPLRVGNSGALLNLVGSSVTSAAVLYPTVDNSFTLGKSGNRWSQLWAGTTTINTSDASTKNSIAETRLGLDFINKLTASEYKFNNGKRVHYGFIAQDIKKVLDILKIDSNDFAGYVDPSIEDPNDKSPCGLRYSEFIAPLVRAVQELSSTVEKLKIGRVNIN